MILRSLVAVALVGTALSGCASIIKGQSQEIAITTPPATGASCTLTSPRGQWTVTTPAAVTVKRSKKDVQIHCTKDGYQDASATIPSDFELWALGNLLAGGVIGVGVDASTGAINKYPSTFEVPMSPSKAAGPIGTPAKSSTTPTS
jgi:hypothetical protein